VRWNILARRAVPSRERRTKSSSGRLHVGRQGLEHTFTCRVGRGTSSFYSRLAIATEARSRFQLSVTTSRKEVYVVHWVDYSVCAVPPECSNSCSGRRKIRAIRLDPFREPCKNRPSSFRRCQRAPTPLTPLFPRLERVSRPWSTGCDIGSGRTVGGVSAGVSANGAESVRDRVS